MINANVYNYINVLDKAADAASLRNDAIANNIANVSTPDYKRQDTNFEEVLERALGKSKYTSMDERVAGLNTDLTSLNSRIYEESNVAYRVDGNSVDIDTENAMLAKNQIKYNGIIDSVNQEFKNLMMVMK